MEIWQSLAIILLEILCIFVAYIAGKREGFNHGVDAAFKRMHAQAQQSPQAQRAKESAALQGAARHVYTGQAEGSLSAQAQVGAVRTEVGSFSGANCANRSVVDGEHKE